MEMLLNSKMSWQKLKQILPKDKTSLHLHAEVGSKQVCMLWQKYAAKWFSDYTMKSHEAINFRNGVITIIIRNPLLVDQIKSYQNKIIESINISLGKRLVKSIKYRF